MAVGDLNRKFGWIWLLIGPLMGLFITSQFNRLGAEYASVTREVMIAGQNVTLYMGEASPRIANRLLHVHSALLAVLNIIYGMGIDAAQLSDKTKRLGSILAVLGAILVTAGFYTLQLPLLRTLGFPLRILGGVGLIVAVVIIVAGELKKRG